MIPWNFYLLNTFLFRILSSYQTYSVMVVKSSGPRILFTECMMDQGKKGHFQNQESYLANSCLFSFLNVINLKANVKCFDKNVPVCRPLLINRAKLWILQLNCPCLKLFWHDCINCQTFDGFDNQNIYLSKHNIIKLTLYLVVFGMSVSVCIKCTILFFNVKCNVVPYI